MMRYHTFFHKTVSYRIRLILNEGNCLQIKIPKLRFKLRFLNIGLWFLTLILFESIRLIAAKTATRKSGACWIKSICIKHTKCVIVGQWQSKNLDQIGFLDSEIYEILLNWRGISRFILQKEREMIKDCIFSFLLFWR